MKKLRKLNLKSATLMNDAEMKMIVGGSGVTNDCPSGALNHHVLQPASFMMIVKYRVLVIAIMSKVQAFVLAVRHKKSVSQII